MPQLHRCSRRTVPLARTTSCLSCSIGLLLWRTRAGFQFDASCPMGSVARRYALTETLPHRLFMRKFGFVPRAPSRAQCTEARSLRHGVKDVSFRPLDHGPLDRLARHVACTGAQKSHGLGNARRPGKLFLAVNRKQVARSSFGFVLRQTSMKYAGVTFILNAVGPAHSPVNFNGGLKFLHSPMSTYPNGFHAPLTY